MLKSVSWSPLRLQRMSFSSAAPKSDAMLSRVELAASPAEEGFKLANQALERRRTLMKLRQQVFGARQRVERTSSLQQTMGLMARAKKFKPADREALPRIALAGMKLAGDTPLERGKVEEEVEELFNAVTVRALELADTLTVQDIAALLTSYGRLRIVDEDLIACLQDKLISSPSPLLLPSTDIMSVAALSGAVLKLPPLKSEALTSLLLQKLRLILDRAELEGKTLRLNAFGLSVLAKFLAQVSSPPTVDQGEPGGLGAGVLLSRLLGIQLRSVFQKMNTQDVTDLLTSLGKLGDLPEVEAHLRIVLSSPLVAQLEGGQVCLALQGVVQALCAAKPGEEGLGKTAFEVFLGHRSIAKEEYLSLKANVKLLRVLCDIHGLSSKQEVRRGAELEDGFWNVDNREVLRSRAQRVAGILEKRVKYLDFEDALQVLFALKNLRIRREVLVGSICRQVLTRGSELKFYDLWQVMSTLSTLEITGEDLGESWDAKGDLAQALEELKTKGEGVSWNTKIGTLESLFEKWKLARNSLHHC